jgi:hypothetical protein
MKVALLSLVLITGCQLNKPAPHVCETEPKIDPPMPSAIVLTAPIFYVVSEENKASFEARIKEDSNGVFYAITPDGYTILSENLQELRRYVRELQQIILYYKRYDENLEGADKKPLISNGG